MNCRSGAVFVCGALLLVLFGCTDGSPKPAARKQVVVPISEVVQREVTDYVDFTGRTDAINTVNIVPRVTGYLMKMPFTEGSLVKKDDLLFEVDPRPYKAQLDQAEGQVTLYKAQLKLAKSTLDRDIEISKTPGAVSPQQLDQDRAAVEQAEASVKAAQASLEVYSLNLSFCRVTSPIDGMVARYYLTLGNLVNQDQTLLTTVVSLDPMYAYFEMDEPTLVTIRQAIGQGKLKSREEGKLHVFMALQGEDGYPHDGTINFVNNQVNPGTGSISVRGVFDNPPLKGTVRLLSPGMFVRIHLPLGEKHPALLVIDRAIGSDQGLKYVYVIDDQNKAKYTRVTTGALEPDGLRIITSGLKPGDKVAVGSLQQIRPNEVIETDLRPMPMIRQPMVEKEAQKVEDKAGGTSGPKSETKKEKK
jgi:membrane fusion protein, multidrug efflux system